MGRVLILALLLGAMRAILPLGSAGEGSETLLAFGFLVLAAHTVGEIAAAVRVPKIIGYLAAGVLFGPSAFGAVSHDAVVALGPIGQLAIALIAFLAGAELRWSEVRDRGVFLLKLTVSELACSFVALAAVLWALHGVSPALRDFTAAEALAVSLLFGGIAIVHSPAVTMALLSDTGARGPVARTTLGVVLLADIVVVLVFSATAAAARALVPLAAPGEAVSVGSLVWEIAGAILVGALLGGAVALYLRFIGRELFLFALLVTFLGSEVARLAHVETLLTLLTAGFLTENLTDRLPGPARVVARGGSHGEALRHAMERSAAPVFVVFFALSGAKIDVGGVLSVLLLVVPLALTRIGAMWAGIRLGTRWARRDAPPETVAAAARYTWLGLVSQAGVAIGLATIAAESFPRLGPPLRTLLLALIA
ncbi:MAG TPA: cation:proton antiporter, partial [Gemmatimonadales bacterium]|nr:cation:proton antiporter [Gemmatimonadales bacterium]